MKRDESDQELVDRAVRETVGLRLVGDKPDEREEWLRWRRSGLGASDIAGVLGLSPWASPWSVWAQKKGLLAEQDQTEAMEFGSRAEELLARYFEDRTGLFVIGEQTRCERPSDPWMRATVDGFAFDGETFPAEKDDAVAVVEFKTTSDPVEAWKTEVPLHYACQATWTTIVTGHPVVMFGVLHLAFGRPKFRTYEFHPSDDDVRLVEARAREFWTRHILEDVEPPVDSSEATTEALRSAYPSGDPQLDAVDAGPEILSAINRIAANKTRVKDCQKVIAEEENVIRAAMGDRTVLVHGLDDRGKPRIVATWKEQHRSGYVVEPSTSRVLRVKGM